MSDGGRRTVFVENDMVGAEDLNPPATRYINREKIELQLLMKIFIFYSLAVQFTSGGVGEWKGGNNRSTHRRINR